MVATQWRDYETDKKQWTNFSSDSKFSFSFFSFSTSLRSRKTSSEYDSKFFRFSILKVTFGMFSCSCCTFETLWIPRIRSTNSVNENRSNFNSSCQKEQWSIHGFQVDCVSKDTERNTSREFRKILWKLFEPTERILITVNNLVEWAPVIRCIPRNYQFIIGSAELRLKHIHDWVGRKLPISKTKQNEHDKPFATVMWCVKRRQRFKLWFSVIQEARRIKNVEFRQRLEKCTVVINRSLHLPSVSRMCRRLHSRVSGWKIKIKCTSIPYLLVKTSSQAVLRVRIRSKSSNLASSNRNK